jgi:hypothetical protein
VQRAHAGDARREQDARGRFHAAHEIRAVACAESVGDARTALARQRDRAVRRIQVGSVADEHDQVRRATEPAHELLVLRANADGGDRRECGMMRGALDPEAVAVVVMAQEFVAHGRLWDSGGRVHVGCVFAPQPRRGMEAKVAANAAAAHPGPLQNDRRADGAGSHNDDRRLDDECAERPTR